MVLPRKLFHTLAMVSLLLNLLLLNLEMLDAWGNQA
jgi:hypothetical protein